MRNWLEVDLNKLAHNVDTVREILPEGCDLIAVVKANAYGHGEGKIARALEELGVSRFAVASLGEATNIRNEGVSGDVLVLSYVDPKDALEAVRDNITLAVISKEHAMALSDEAKKNNVSIKVHVKLNTGMNRVGFDCCEKEELEELASIYKLEGLDFTGIFSHFSSSDDLSDGADEYTKLQLERFENTLEYLKEKNINVGLRHISNSGGIGKYPNARFDAVRCGALLYGYNTAVDAPLPVIPIGSWKSVVSTVRTLKKGEAVSYSRHYIAKGGEKIATLCVGYADGYKRALGGKESGNAFVLINGKRCEIVGSICMDQMMVNVTDASVNAGDIAILMSEDLTADELAERAGTCMHDIIACIGPRVERVYKQLDY